MASARRGRQEPRLCVLPSGIDITDGPDAARLIGAYGFELDPWQRTVVDAWCARDGSDAPLYQTCGISCPRQNGKNGALEAFEAYKMLVCGERILHTAHQVKTANKSFQRLVALLTNTAHPEVCAMVQNVRRTNGEQAIYLTNGGLVEYSARSRGASRGNTYSCVIYDEAQELTDEQVEALMSTIAASPTGYRQLVYLGTPPGPTCPGEVFARIRKGALERGPERTCWHEWSVEHAPSESATWADVVDDCYATNPALGYRLDESFTRTEFETMSRDGFARERLGWWSSQTASAKLREGDWDACAIDPSERPRDGKLAFAVKFSPDGADVALAGCRLPEEGPALVSLIGKASGADGISWLTDFLCDPARVDSVAAIAVDGRRGGDDLLNRLAGEYPRQALMQPGTRGVAAAAQMLYEGIRGREVAHTTVPRQQALADSALTAVERPIGRDGAWGFGGTDSCPIEAASLAYWAARTTRRDTEGCVVL